MLSREGRRCRDEYEASCERREMRVSEMCGQPSLAVDKNLSFHGPRNLMLPTPSRGLFYATTTAGIRSRTAPPPKFMSPTLDHQLSETLSLGLFEDRY